MPEEDNRVVRSCYDIDHIETASGPFTVTWVTDSKGEVSKITTGPHEDVNEAAEETANAICADIDASWEQCP